MEESSTVTGVSIEGDEIKLNGMDNSNQPPPLPGSMKKKPGSKPGVSRGPYKKDKKNTKPPRNKKPPKTNSNSTTVGSDYQDLADRYTSTKDPDATAKTTAQVSTSSDPVVNNPNPEGPGPAVHAASGNELIALTNMVMPMLCIISLRVTSKGKKKVPLSHFKMDEDDKEALEETADAAAEEILGYIPKSIRFIIAIGSMYTAKWIAAYDWEKSQNVLEEEKITVITAPVESKKDKEESSSDVVPFTIHV